MNFASSSRIITDGLPAIVVGNYLYIDGGEISYYNDGVPTHLPGMLSAFRLIIVGVPSS